MLEDPLWQDGNDYPARLDRQFIEDVFDIEGVIRTTTPGALAVSQRAAGANMSVDVAAGRAVIKGDDETNQGSYRVISTAVENLPIGAAPGSDSRIDLVVARVRDANVTGGVSSDWILEVIPGAVAAAPVASAVPNTAIPLAQILVAAGTASITTAMITDRRGAATSTAYGGPAQAVTANVLTTETTTSTSYTALATAGPAVTVTPGASGKILIILDCEAKTSAADILATMSFVGSGGNTVAVSDDNAAVRRMTSLSSTTRHILLTGLAVASTTFTAQYRVGGAATAEFTRRRIVAIPL